MPGSVGLAESGFGLEILSARTVDVRLTGAIMTEGRMRMAEYIDKAILKEAFEEDGHLSAYVEEMIDLVPAADVVERKPLPEDVEELVKDLYAFSKDCTDSDMCRDCQLCFMCEDGWPPNAIAHLIEAWKEKQKAMVERKSGKWLKSAWSIRCSECGYDMPFAVRNFCPNCGADMREES